MASKAALDKITIDLGSKLEGSDVIISLADPGWCRTDLGGPQAPNAPESTIPGIVIGAFVDDGRSGRLFGAQDYNGLTLEEAYEKVKNPKYTNEPFPEIAYRLAGIRTEEGKKNEAIDLLYNAKTFMTQRLYYAAFWGHIEVMGRIVRSLYELIDFNEESFDLYDIFYLENRPGKITFRKDDKKYTIKISEEDNEIHFDGKWYRNFLELCEKAVIDGEKITSLYYDLYEWRYVR